jgi:hypothetical protein
VALVLTALLLVGGGALVRPPGPAAAPPPGQPAPPRVVEELRTTLARAVARFEAKDVAGVLAHVSAEYRTGPFTRASVRAQLVTLFEVYARVSARVLIDEVRLVDGRAWVYSTGEVAGQLPLIGGWVPLFSWEHELEVARREGLTWRLFGYQQ